MVYDDAGNWLRAELVSDQEFVAECSRSRDALMEAAVPLNDYAHDGRVRT